MGTPRNGEKLGQRLLKLKEELEKRKEERSQVQCELNSISKQLEEEFGVKTIEEAESLKDSQEKEIAEMDETIANQIKEIEEMMSDGDN